MLKSYLRYWQAGISCILQGSWLYLCWVGALFLISILGVVGFAIQIDRGFVVTHLTDQVSWGVYIANFNYLVGVAAASVLLVVPSYVYHRDDVREVVLVAELMAVAAITTALIFVIVDLGRPDRMLHILPFIGRLNFPRSILAWDVVILLGYLFLSLHIPSYLLFQRWRGREPKAWAYVPFVFVSIVWAISTHTATAFLFSGLAGRTYWNTAILAPRFLVSAFASGPALLLIALFAMERFGALRVRPTVIEFMRRLVATSLWVSFFLLGCELFEELYPSGHGGGSAHYLFFGFYGHGLLVPYIWGAVAMGFAALAIFSIPGLYSRPHILLTGSVLCAVAVWIEKGMGLIVPGFIPSPLGDLVEYSPSPVETLVCAGVWAFGGLAFTFSAKVAVAIQTGTLTEATFRKSSA